MKAKNNDTSSLIATFILIAILLLVWWGMENTEVALFLIEHPVMILPYVLEKLVNRFGYLKLISGSFIAASITVFLLKPNNQLHRHNQSVRRGATVIPTRRLKAILKKQPKLRNQPQLKIAGLPIPHQLENRGFLITGSPGTGKTQAISQTTATIRQRTDFRAIIFDRNGEMLEKFYDPTQDLIFNPFDARSVHWSHVYEAARPETMAAALIPQESVKEPFFSNAGRAVMAELFRQTKSNQELWSLLISDTQTLSSLISGTLAARYLGEEKTATSVLSTAANYCQFYACLTQPQNKALSFYEWARSDSPRWIFVTLREDESELLKPLHSLIFELMLKGLLSNEQRTRKTAIIIDELGALNELPSLHRLLSESRKYWGCPILGTQTEAQITKIYGLENTRTILQGTKTKLILNCNDPQTAEAMAKIIGRQEFIHTSENHSRSRHSGRSGNGRTVTLNEQPRESYAVMPDELANLRDLHGYLKIAQDCAPIQLKLKKFAVRARRFVPLPSSSTDLSIEAQWRDLEE
ncbi:MAG: type IV secretion system DNA-binding domain-containing protein [Pleurocapsa sp. CRU_1_2]|nr:type IV secretion system DNA-binding domain-containing protein [Pleurocapsa sp. CRU_1_2]